MAANYKALSDFAVSAEGKRLLSVIGSRGGAEVQKAAEGIKKGDVNAMRDLMSLLKNTEEGRLLARKIVEITRK